MASVLDQQVSWIDRLPPRLRDFAMLGRWDRPIGTWLLLIPCWWGQFLATAEPDIALMAWFALGAFAMRGAGCAINDLVDVDLDRHVERTRNRPLPAGRLSKKEAIAFILAQMAIGLVVLVQLPSMAQIVALASVPLVIIYPFMKRVTYWPQAFLGLTFNWGVLVGYASEAGTLELPAFVLYASAMAWTLGYDTIYAHQDREDDLSIGIKSLAIFLGDKTKPWLVLFFGLTMTGIVVAASFADRLTIISMLTLSIIASALLWNIIRVDLASPTSCLGAFRFHRLVGLLVLAALWVGTFKA